MPSPLAKQAYRRFLLPITSLLITFTSICTYSFFPVSASYAHPNLTEIQDIWAGYVAEGQKGLYRGVKATFTVPSIPPTKTHNSDFISTWVGVGNGKMARQDYVPSASSNTISLGC